MSNISDRQFADLSRFEQDLPAYRRREYVRSVAKTMVTISEFELELAKKEKAKGEAT